jgi:hypothetical protein
LAAAMALAEQRLAETGTEIETKTGTGGGRGSGSEATEPDSGAWRR